MNTTDHINELNNGIKILQKIIKEYKTENNIEIELRIGQIIENRFKSGLNSENFYNKIKQKLDSYKDWSQVLCTKTDELNNNGIRKITHFNGKKITKSSSIKKQRLKNINLEYINTPYDIRISVSKETDSEIKIKTGTLRVKERNSYFYKDYRFDLTKVTQTENTVESIIYEFEVEFMNLDNNVSDLYRAHSALLIIRDIINMCEEIVDAKLELDCKEEMSNLTCN